MVSARDELDALAARKRTREVTKSLGFGRFQPGRSRYQIPDTMPVARCPGSPPRAIAAPPRVGQRGFVDRTGGATPRAKQRGDGMSFPTTITAGLFAIAVEARASARGPLRAYGVGVPFCPATWCAMACGFCGANEKRWMKKRSPRFSTIPNARSAVPKSGTMRNTSAKQDCRSVLMT